MNVALEHIPYRIYPHTFLQDVVVVMGFESHVAGEPTQEIPMDRLKTFLLDNFGFQLPDGAKRNYASLSNEEIGLNFQFYSDKVSLRVNCKNYQSFDATVMPLVYKLRVYVRDVLGHDSVDYAKIRKVDTFPFQMPDHYEDSIYEQMMRHLLNSDLLDSPAESTEEVENGKTPFARHQITSGEHVFTVKTGVIRASDGDDVCAVILDTSSKTMSANPIALTDIETSMRDLNLLMFDLFHWAVNDEVTEVMEMQQNNDSEGDESSI